MGGLVVRPRGVEVVKTVSSRTLEATQRHASESSFIKRLTNAGACMVPLPRSSRGPVVSGVQTRIVELLGHSKPVGSVYSFRGCGVGTVRKCGHDLQPTVGAFRDVTYFAGHLGEILILAENDRDIQFCIACHSHHVEAQTQVNALLALNGQFVNGAVWKADSLNTIANRPGRDGDAGPPHRCEAPCPVPVPHGRGVRARDAGIKPDAAIDPAVFCTDGVGKQARVVVRMMVAERILRVAVQVLAVEK